MQAYPFLPLKMISILVSDQYNVDVPTDEVDIIQGMKWHLWYYQL